jgi:transposase
MNGSTNLTAMIAKLKVKSFQSSIAGYSAKQIAAAIGCSLATAYDWRSGRRSPPRWIQSKYIEEIRRNAIL